VSVSLSVCLSVNRITQNSNRASISRHEGGGGGTAKIV